MFNFRERWECPLCGQLNEVGEVKCVECGFNLLEDDAIILDLARGNSREEYNTSFQQLIEEN